MNKYILIATSCITMTYALHAQSEPYTYMIDDVEITLKIGTPHQKSIPFEKALPLYDPLNTNSINLITSALTNSTCLTPEATLPTIFHNLLHDVFSHQVSITTVPSLTSRGYFDFTLMPTTVCGFPSTPQRQKIHVIVANQQLFDKYKKRLMIIYELLPKIDEFAVQYAQKYRDDDDVTGLLRFVATMRRVKQNMIRKN
jgi:hypothetical protein